MRSTAGIAISLILFMLLLVTGAAIFFLFQNQIALQGDVTSAEMELQALDATKTAVQLDLTSANATRTAQEMMLATAEAENIQLNNELVQSDMQMATLEAETTRLTEELQVLETGPIINVLSPRNGVTVQSGQEVNILISASDAVGVATLQVSIDGDVIAETTSTTTSATLAETWIPEEPGTFQLVVEATNSEGISAEPVLVSVRVPAPPTPTPTPDAAPADSDEE